MVVDDGLLLRRLDPEVARYQGVVLVRLAVAILPVEELPPDLQPANEALGRQLGLVGPRANEVDHLVARVVGNPTAVQGSPSSFFRATYSPLISAMIESFFASLASSFAMRASSSFSRLDATVLFGALSVVAAFSNNCRCQ